MIGVAAAVGPAVTAAVGPAVTAAVTAAVGPAVAAAMAPFVRSLAKTHNRLSFLQVPRTAATSYLLDRFKIITFLEY